MFLNNTELELLKLCAIGRFVPCSIAGKYDLQELRTPLINSFIKKSYIKIVKGDERCYRLTRRGRDLLYNAGYQYPDDSRPRKEGGAFKRRLINSEINAILYGAGIDIYMKSVEGLNDKDRAYISSLTIRSDIKSKALAGTRFYGVLRIGDTAYVIYYADNEMDYMFPKYEEQTFSNLISGLTHIRHIVILIMSGTVEGLMRIMFPDTMPSLNRGHVSYSQIMQEWKYEFCMLPMNRDGLLQMRINSVEGMKGQIAGKFGNTIVPPGLSCFDAVKDGKAFMVATDMNITRVSRGLEQTLYTDYIPHIICLPYQRTAYQELAVRKQYPKLMKFTVLNRSKVIDQFPILGGTANNLKPARAANGEYIDVGIERG